MRVLSCPPRGPELYARRSRDSTSAARAPIDALARGGEDALEEPIDSVELEALDAEALRATRSSADQRDLRALHAELVGEEGEQRLVRPPALGGAATFTLSASP